jgi:hypothetical protein
MTTVTACDDLFLIISSRTRDTVINREKPSQVVTAVTEVRGRGTNAAPVLNYLDPTKEGAASSEVKSLPRCQFCATRGMRNFLNS